MKHIAHERTWNPAADIRAPLKWRKFGMVRIACDVFADLAEEDRDRVFAVVALCPKMTFQMATDNAKGMAEYVAATYIPGGILCAIDDLSPNDPTGAMGGVWPLPNLILGVTVRDQREADEKIPWLLKCPAVCRWLDVRPRGPIEIKFALGQYIDRHGNWRQGEGVSWVTCSGNEDPMHPLWVRSLRDQCVAASVPFLFNGWGEWMPWRASCGPMPEDLTEAESNGMKRIHISGKFPAVPPKFKDADEREKWLFKECCNVVRVGSGRSGRTLEGKTWDEMPKMGEPK